MSRWCNRDGRRRQSRDGRIGGGEIDQGSFVERKDEPCNGVVFLILQNPRALRRMSRFEESGQFLYGGKFCKAGIAHQGWHNCRDGKTRIARVPGVAAASPTVLVLLVPDAAEFIRQSLSLVAVAGHAPVPVQISSQLIFGWILWKRRLRQRIIGGSR